MLIPYWEIGQEMTVSANIRLHQRGFGETKDMALALGKRIKAMRLEAGYESAGAIAEEITLSAPRNITGSCIENWECGGNLPSFVKLCDFVSVARPLDPGTALLELYQIAMHNQELDAQ